MSFYEKNQFSDGPKNNKILSKLSKTTSSRTPSYSIQITKNLPFSKQMLQALPGVQCSHKKMGMERCVQSLVVVKVLQMQKLAMTQRIARYHLLFRSQLPQAHGNQIPRHHPYRSQQPQLLQLHRSLFFLLKRILIESAVMRREAAHFLQIGCYCPPNARIPWS